MKISTNKTKNKKYSPKNNNNMTINNNKNMMKIKTIKILQNKLIKSKTLILIIILTIITRLNLVYNKIQKKYIFLFLKDGINNNSENKDKK